MILIAAPLVTCHLSLVIKQWERCQSGRSSTLGKRVYRKVPRVRIPPSPQENERRNPVKPDFFVSGPRKYPRRSLEHFRGPEMEKYRLRNFLFLFLVSVPPSGITSVIPSSLEDFRGFQMKKYRLRNFFLHFLVSVPPLGSRQ